MPQRALFRRPSFNEAEAFTPRIRVEARASTRKDRSGFNEAEAFTPRIGSTDTARRRFVVRASMRPRLLHLGSIREGSRGCRARQASMRPRLLHLGSRFTFVDKDMRVLLQ